MFVTPKDYQAYWLDTFQRSILFLDVLRERGNQFVEHVRSGKPPVLVFDHELILDGETLERPCNYFLLRIRPPADRPTDPRKRPFVVFDPRAGHGPGIGGSKEASQVGVALQAGHPVYFVAFRPKPVPGQTLSDVAWAEKAFLDKVAELHPEAEAKPAIVGNCQAGWAIMMLSAYAPEQSSVIAVAGAPLSYWAGVEGRDPMRYFGGLMGGNWLAAMMADMGNGVFDGSNLVTNFENLNPANTLIGKPYNLYSKVDTERERFLDFEKWWGGYFLMTKAEMIQLTSELFIGNKLAGGGIVAADGTPIDLRAIRAPIVVICSEGDNITPPAQALNWMLDLYDDVEEMKANEQTIIYTVHPTIGHLGIFVSARVAVKEHAKFVNSLDLIEALPPGLFEMVVEKVVEDATGCESYTVRFESRSFADIRAYDDGREDEKPFIGVARASEISEGLYETFLGPWVRMMSNETTAEAARWMNFQRMRYAAFSDLNPLMLGVKAAAGMVRANRAEASPDNPLRAAEMQAVGQAQAALEKWTVQRDLALEQLFKAIWTSPLTLALSGEAATHADSKKPVASHHRAYEELKRLKLEAIRGREGKGSFAEAVLRMIYAAIKAGGGIDARAFSLAREAKLNHPALAGVDDATLRREAREAALMVAFDEDEALGNLPRLLPGAAERREALDILRKLIEWRPDMAPEVRAVLARVEGILGVTPPDEAATAPAAAAPGPAEAEPVEAQSPKPGGRGRAKAGASAGERVVPERAARTRRGVTYRH